MGEIELLQQYGDSNLVRELHTWEAMRARLTIPKYVAPEQPSRTLILLDGIPGAGKSTTLSWLKPAVDAEWMSMARFAGAAGVSRDERMAHELSTATPHRVDSEFIAAINSADASAGAIDEKTSHWLALEKFPRSVVEAIAMLDACRLRGWRFEVLHLFLPGDCVKTSVERQLARGVRHGIMPTTESATHRALAHLARAKSCRESLRAAGVPIHSIDTSQSPETVERLVRRALRLDFGSLDFRREPLEVLERVSTKLGIEAWVAGGHLYRAFWNGMFGPAQRPHDVDVAVTAASEEAPLLEALRREAPEHDWSVLSAVAKVKRELGFEVADVREAKTYATFLHRAGLVRWSRGEPELFLPEGVEASLRSGVVRLNVKLLERLTETQRRELIARQAHRVPSVLLDYPGLRVGPGLDWKHEPRAIRRSWRHLKKNVNEVVPVRVGHNRRRLVREEVELAQQILHFHQTTEPSPEAPPNPRGEKLEGTFEHLAASANDADFARWISAQTRRHHEVKPDDFLHSVLSGSLFGSTLANGPREQSAMHQGWSLERHLAQALMQLNTSVARDNSQLRRAMRLAVLFHDTGKLAGKKPRRHATISAALFGTHRPDWFPDELVPLTQWMISTHDLFGVFGRGLTEKQGHPVADYALDLTAPSSYAFALDSQAVRRALRESGLALEHATAINKAIWCADVGSIASLRWLLPTAELVERLVLISTSR